MQKFKKCLFCKDGIMERKIKNETLFCKRKSVTISNYVIYECNTCGMSIVDRKTLKKSGKKLRKIFKPS
ncbi:YgiT-type zinc finger protein [Thermodesulfovibrio sp. 3907-1M]|jgi:YgiT-type zinc finger domain-containing protein|uniref:YgiT-type zinc finger protein n=1 Tax=Thermodesulfovibrio autotrophicus TaxID=3118333 RepID=UPI00338FE153